MILSTIVTASLAFSGAFEAPATEGAPVATPTVEEVVLQPINAETAVAFKAKRVYLGDGNHVDDGIVLVQDGVIHSVGADVAVPKGVSVIELDGVLTPGLIASHSHEGLGGESVDTTRPTMPDADIAIAFQPKHEDFAASLAAGVTSVVLAPSPSTLIPGTTAVVKTSGGKVVRRPAQLEVVLSGAALNWNSFPTSHAGAIAELDRLFSEPEGQIARATSGNLPVLLAVDDRSDISRAVSFAGRYRLRGALYGSKWAEDLIEPIAKSGLGVVCDPFDVGDDSRAMRSVVALSKRGVRLGFGLDAPGRDPQNLRFGAALCVRAGLDPKLALKAMCADAASIAGVERRIGKLERGLDADMVLWSGDPTELTSSVIAVYVDGTLVHGGEE
ncbi:MAG: amidohydrolase family protein [Planctomycetes bacterium]|nr:amidohydrolase family protein [Planctomycetota bacterium]MCB9902778.1 amidohydrolase family protein [Planctomycetota bacterium]